MERDPHTAETVALSVITFATEAELFIPLTAWKDFLWSKIDRRLEEPPKTGATNLGKAIELLFNQYDREVKSRMERLRVPIRFPGEVIDYQPLAIIMTDGKPSDTALFDKMAEKMKTYKFSKVIGCMTGMKAKEEPLNRIADVVVHLDTIDTHSFGEFWE